MFQSICMIFLLFFIQVFTAPLNTSSSPEDYSIDLSHYGNKIYGIPNPAVGEKLKKLNKTQLKYAEQYGGYLEGDILIPSKTLNRNGLIRRSSKWRHGIIPYVIESYYNPDEIKTILAAMEEFHKYTCIKFRPRDEINDRDYVAIVNGSTGCWAGLGRQTYRQVVNLQNTQCTWIITVAMHEFMHALGFVHEQSRHDRDDYIIINWENIEEGRETEFKKLETDITTSFGIPYNYQSLMHYNTEIMSKNGKPTMVAKDPSKTKLLGHKKGFTQEDIDKINIMYKCPMKKLQKKSNN